MGGYIEREIYLSLLVLLPVLLPGFLGKIYSISVYLILAIFTSANYIHAYLYDIPIASYVYNVVSETYTSEIIEFVQQYFHPILILKIFLLFTIPLLFLILSLKSRPIPATSSWILVGVISSLFIFKCLDKTPYTVVRWHYMADFLWSCLDEEKERKKFLAETTKAVHIPSGIVNDRKSARLIVVVVGEASGRRHYSLYGYPRPTTPYLVSRKEELVIFSDVISPHSHTIPSLEKMFTFANHEGDESLCSIIDVLQASGYYVITLSNQLQLGPYETASGRILGRSDELHYFNNGNTNGYYTAASYDEILLPPFRKAVSRPGDVAVVLHLMGSHSKYSMRFPPSAARFDDVPPDAMKFSLKARQIQEINDYDNSIVYTDHVLEQIFQILEKQSRPSAFIYVSDHGEAMYEDGRTRGHAENALSRFMFEIPLVIRLSPEYRKERPGFFEALKTYENRPWQTDDLIFSILNLAGTTCNAYKPAKDVLSPDFIPEQRLMGGKDYDVMFHGRTR